MDFSYRPVYRSEVMSCFVLNTDYDIVVARPEAFAIAKKKASA